jgi:hypothetical protein
MVVGSLLFDKSVDELQQHLVTIGRPHGRDRAVAQRVGSLRFPCILFALR